MLTAENEDMVMFMLEQLLRLQMTRGENKMNRDLTSD